MTDVIYLDEYGNAVDGGTEDVYKRQSPAT